VRTLAVAALLLAVVTITAPDAQTAAIIVHDIASAPGRGAIQLKAAVTDEGSVGFALARPSVTQTGHHHQQEQVVLPLEKPMNFTIGNTTSALNKYTAAIPPSNTHHFYATNDGEPTPFIEYQPVRRDDWVGLPYKPLQTPEALQPPAGREMIRDLSPASGGWTTTGATRTKEFSGDQIKIVMIALGRAGTSIELPPSTAGRQFLYVLEGKPSLMDGSSRRAVAPHTVVEMSASAKPIRFEAPTDGTALIALFSPLRRN